ncbi:uncharacterized protein LOC132199294 [Neocloeon triangulifer]|uniref:uncharacterized protein LOC132199294 n=1 Tax=Neocloeon triangulifer TaxID=2078957 RepID=UPI00286F98DD|nr:uncharacterized protein LOC132199294 [Neocloeon triangulifer]
MSRSPRRCLFGRPDIAVLEEQLQQLEREAAVEFRTRLAKYEVLPADIFVAIAEPEPNADQQPHNELNDKREEVVAAEAPEVGTERLDMSESPHRPDEESQNNLSPLQTPEEELSAEPTDNE